MALLPMNIADLITSVRHTLQDTAGDRWSDSEIFTYIDKANRDHALRTKRIFVEEDISVVDGTTIYTLSNEAIEFIGIDTTQSYKILDATRIEFEDPSAETVTVKYYAFPARIKSGVDTTITLDEDIYDAIQYYVLYKCYEKEDSTENLQKATYFKANYLDIIRQHSSRWHGQFDITPFKNDFYI